MASEIEIFEKFSKLACNPKVQALQTTLVQSFTSFKDLILEFEGLYTKLECYKNQILTQEEKCENKSCASSIALKQMIAEKDKTIQSIGNILIELNESKNLNIITEAFRIIFGEQSPLTPPKSTEEKPFSKSEPENIQKDYVNLPSELHNEFCSTSDIEGSSTGRRSPVIQIKKLKNSSATSIDSPRSKDKMKCPETWPSPDKKMVKLLFPTPTRSKNKAKLRQSRLSFVHEKTTRLVDLTCSPAAVSDSIDSNLQKIKQEVMENDDTILPSPTSASTTFSTIYKSITMNSPRKVRKSLSVLKPKSKDKDETKKVHDTNKYGDLKEDIEVANILKESNWSKTVGTKLKPTLPTKVSGECTTFLEDNDENCPDHGAQDKELEQSINILRHFPDRFPISPEKTLTTVKVNSRDVNDSMSLLQRINKLDDKSQDVLRHPCRTKPDPVEPIFKEPTVRKKSEKLALPGWSCEECKQFYDKLYRDDPDMARQKMDECSRHRGRSDTARPRTPPGFWQPRWHVPVDTDDFNRLNDAL